MNNIYDKCKKVWDDIFTKEQVRIPEDKDIGNEDLNAGLDWLCDGVNSVLDFGCGNGSFLFQCALRGTEKHWGIDISDAGVDLAMRRAEKMPTGEFSFRVGDVTALETIEDSSADAVIISNVIDNLIPDDAGKLLKEVKRILRPQGKLLIKLNPYLEQKQLEEWNIKVIEGNLLDDGLLLWNQTTEEWTKMFEQHFEIEHYREIYYEKYEQYNRLFLLTK